MNNTRTFEERKADFLKALGELQLLYDCEVIAVLEKRELGFTLQVDPYIKIRDVQSGEISQGIMNSSTIEPSSIVYVPVGYHPL